LQHAECRQIDSRCGLSFVSFSAVVRTLEYSINRRSLEKVVPENAIDGFETILPVDLLSLLVGPSIIRDAHFIDPDIGYLADLGRDLRFETKAFFLQVDRLYELRVEKLITRFHVRQIEIGEHVRKESEEFIPDGMPEKENSMRAATGKT
jgi:hypothetical protein